MKDAEQQIVPQKTFFSPFLSSIVAGREEMEEGELADDDDEDNTQSSVPQISSSSSSQTYLLFH